MPVFVYPPMLEVRAIVARFDRPPARFVVPHGEAPLADRMRMAYTMRDLFARFGRRRQHTTRHGGARLLRRAQPPISPAVDAGNHAARDSGLPVAVVDLERLRGALRISTTPDRLRMLDERGSSRDVGKLPCVADALGPCVTPVAIRHDARVTAATTTTLSIVWGHSRFATELDDTVRAHRAQLELLGAHCEPLVLAGPGDDPVGRALLQIVLDDPADAHARLVFADWLDTFDNACHRRRARLIRESLAGNTPWDILGDVAIDIDSPPGYWERGFVARLDLANSLREIAPVLHREPVEVARIHQLPHDALPASVWDIAVWQQALGPVPHRDPHRIRKLQASGKPSDDFWPWLGSLRALTWLSLRVDLGDAVRLPLLPALQTLIVEQGSCTAAALAGLAPTLETLHLNSVEIDGFPRLPQLTKLTLYRMTIESLEPFAGLPLRELHVDVRGLTRVDIARILSFETLEVIGVHGDADLERAVSRAIDEGALPNVREVYGLYPSRSDLRPR